MARILILIATHLCGSPRPQKEAETLAAAGHNVMVRGCWYDPELVERDRLLMADKKWQFEPFFDFQPSTNLQRLKNRWVRFQRRMILESYRRFGIFSPEILGFGVRAMLHAARRERADLTIVHSEGGLWVGNRLLNEGFKVGVDFEDWFSEDLLPEARGDRPITQLKALERRLARDCIYSLTTSHALADALAEAYQAPKPSVLYNVFPSTELEQIDHHRRDRRNADLPSLHWFSQTIGPGRGLETLMEALPHITIKAEIHLRGNYPPSARQWFEPLVPTAWRDRLFIHPTVHNTELLSRIAEHDIGLALEWADVVSSDLTTSNKLFQYLQGGLAVVATDTSGQREVLSQCPGAGQLVPVKDGLALAQALEALLHDPNKLSAAKAAALRAAQDQFCWERHAKTLLQAANFALSK